MNNIDSRSIPTQIVTYLSPFNCRLLGKSNIILGKINHRTSLVRRFLSVMPLDGTLILYILMGHLTSQLAVGDRSSPIAFGKLRTPLPASLRSILRLEYVRLDEINGESRRIPCNSTVPRHLSPIAGPQMRSFET